MKPDRQLGMDRDITRRDLIHGAGLAALENGLAVDSIERRPGFHSLREDDQFKALLEKHEVE